MGYKDIFHGRKDTPQINEIEVEGDK